MIGSVVRIGQPAPVVAMNLTDKEIWNTVGLSAAGGLFYYWDKNDASLLGVPVILILIFALLRDGQPKG